MSLDKATGEFVCEECGKEFYEKSDYEKHMQAETYEAPYIKRVNAPAMVFFAFFAIGWSIVVASVYHDPLLFLITLLVEGAIILIVIILMIRNWWHST